MTLLALALLLVSVATIVLAVLSTRRAARVGAELDRRAKADTLTGLPNRIVFEADLEGAVEEARRSGRRLTVLMFELNRFAVINETYGHEIGDDLMKSVVSQIKGVNPAEALYRYSGPQFGIICDGIATAEAARAKANALQGSLSVPFKVARDTIRVTASIGFTVTDPGPRSWSEVLEDAVVALREANERGVGSVVAYEMSQRGRISPATADKRLRTALEQGQFSLLYMPLVTLWDNSLVGAEALLRWADPERGGAIIAPGEFIKALDETGLIVPVGAWVLGEACRQTARWQEEFAGRDLTTTVNVSPAQLAHPDFPEILSAAIADSGADPERLCLEITEMTVIRDVEAAWASMREVKKLGVQLALDDFGTGYSSLAYMRQFELDVLKIEPSFVKGLGSSREDEAIVQQIVGLAHSLGMTAVAEGVDSAIQAETLKSLTCDLAQGYYYSQPQPVDVVERMIRKGKVTPGEAQKKSVDWSGGGATVAPDVLSS